MLHLVYNRGVSRDKTALVVVSDCACKEDASAYSIFHDITQDTESEEILMKSLPKIKTLMGFRRLNYWLKNGKKKPTKEYFEIFNPGEGGEKFTVAEILKLTDFKIVYIKNLRTDNCVFQIHEKLTHSSKMQMELEKGGWATIVNGFLWIDSKIKTTSGLCNKEKIKKVFT